MTSANTAVSSTGNVVVVVVLVLVVLVEDEVVVAAIVVVGTVAATVVDCSEVALSPPHADVAISKAATRATARRGDLALRRSPITGTIVPTIASVVWSVWPSIYHHPT